MAWGLEQLVTNVGVSSKEGIICFIVAVASIIPCAKSFQIGMVLLMATMGAVFVWFYNFNLNWVMPLIIFFMALIVMALSLMAVHKNSTTGGFG